MSQLAGVDFQVRAEAVTDDSIVLALRDSAFVANNAPAALLEHLTELDSASLAAHLSYQESGGPLWLVAKTPRALQTAAYRFLHRFGYRWLGPAAGWEIVPDPPNTIRLVESVIVDPVVEAFTYEGNGGVGGSNQPPLPNTDAIKGQWARWNFRQAMPWEVDATSTHVGESFNYHYQCELRADRSMMAWSRGKRGQDDYGRTFPLSCFLATDEFGGKVDPTHHGDGTGVYDDPPTPPWSSGGNTAPACTLESDPADCSAAAQDPADDSDASDNPTVYDGFGGLVRRWSQFVRGGLVGRYATFGVGHPSTYITSSESADGSSNCRCQKCLDLLRAGPYHEYLTAEEQTQDASVSDCYYHLQNHVARYIRHWFGDSQRIGVLAYTTRSGTPLIPIEPTIFVRLLPLAATITWNLTREEIHAAWYAKQQSNPWGPFGLGTELQWALSSVNFDVPTLSPQEANYEFELARVNGTQNFSCQNTFSSLVIGIHLWCCNRRLWEPSLTVSELLDEWFALAFGPCAAPVRAMFDRWWQWDDVSVHEAGEACRNMLEAQALLDAAPDAAIQARLDHVKGFVHYQRLYAEYKAAEVNKVADEATWLAALEAVTLHNAAIFPHLTTHAYRLHTKFYLRMPGVIDTLTAEPGSMAARWLIVDPDAAGWADVPTYSTNDLHAFMVDGASTYPQVVARAAFSDDLQPWTSSADATLVQSPFFASGGKTFRLYKPDASDATINVQLSNGNTSVPTMRVRVTDPSGAVTETELAVSVAAADNNVVISGSAGFYEVRTIYNDTAMRCRVDVPKKCGFVLLDARAGTSGFNTAIRNYFWVPPGTTKIVLVYNTLAPSGVQFYDDGGNAVATTREDPYTWIADVAAGHDGAPWSFTGLYDGTTASGVRFENCPNVLSWSPEQLLVPSEVLPNP